VLPLSYLEKVYKISGKENNYEPVDDRQITCPHCLVKNPFKAYCCLSCFKVIKARELPPIWKRPWPVNRAVSLFCVLFCLCSVLTVHGWLNRVEGHLSYIQEENQGYYQSTENYIIQKTDAKKDADEPPVPIEPEVS